MRGGSRVPNHGGKSRGGHGSAAARDDFGKKLRNAVSALVGVRKWKQRKRGRHTDGKVRQALGNGLRPVVRTGGRCCVPDSDANVGTRVGRAKGGDVGQSFCGCEVVLCGQGGVGVSRETQKDLRGPFKSAKEEQLETVPGCEVTTGLTVGVHGSLGNPECEGGRKVRRGHLANGVVEELDEKEVQVGGSHNRCHGVGPLYERRERISPARRPAVGRETHRGRRTGTLASCKAKIVS